MKILTVDDEFVSRKKAQKILSQYGECDAAAGGMESLDAFVAAHEENVPYDVIFMDIHMGDMDGIDVLRKIRTKESSLNIPYPDRVKVIMLTSSGNLQSVMDSYAEECNAYVVKPFNEEKILKGFEEAGYEVDWE